MLIMLYMLYELNIQWDHFVEELLGEIVGVEELL